MKISDRDKKVIVILLIAAVIALPYVLLLQPYKEKQAALEAEVASLTERYNYLVELNSKRDFYLSEIERLKGEREDIIAGYAEEIRQENTIMFLRGLEFDIPILMPTVSFSGNIITPISEASVDADGNSVGAVSAVQNSVSVSYKCLYEDVKEFLAYILDSDDRMVVSSISMNYDSATGTIGGAFVLNQYAITADGRVLPAAKIPAMGHGNESIFGTYISDPELLEALEEAENGAEEAESED